MESYAEQIQDGALIEDSDQEAMLVEEYLKETPRVNIGALLMPPVWGPAKGMWATILWYPLWVFADNCLFAWYSVGGALSTVIGVFTLLLLAAITVVFARYSTIYAAVRAVQRGKTKEQFRRTELIWAIVSIVLAIAFLAFATYFNLFVRTPLAA